MTGTSFISKGLRNLEESVVADVCNRNPKFVRTSDSNSVTINSLNDNTDYFWRVIAEDLNGASTENTGGYHTFRVNTEN